MQEAKEMKSSSIVSCSFCDLNGSEQAQTNPRSWSPPTHESSDTCEGRSETRLKGFCPPAAGQHRKTSRHHQHGFIRKKRFYFMCLEFTHKNTRVWIWDEGLQRKQTSFSAQGHFWSALEQRTGPLPRSLLCKLVWIVNCGKVPLRQCSSGF